MTWRRVLALLLAGLRFGLAQVESGILDGSVVDARGQPQAGVSITAVGRPGSRFKTRSNARGEFQFVLPYGEYWLSTGVTVYVRPLARTDVGSRMLGIGPGEKTDYVGSSSFDGLLLALEPATVSEPLDFSGLGSARLPLLSQRSVSWTGVRYTLGGLNTTDPYQPGRTMAFPAVEALSDVVVRQGLDISTAPSWGSEIALFARQPDGIWHGEFSSAGTWSFLASDNLPGPATRGSVQQPEEFHRFTRDTLQIAGPLGRRAEVAVSGTGQWAAQSVAQARPGDDLNSSLLLGNALGRVQINSKNQIRAQFSGSRIDLSNWGIPAGLEALQGWRMIPSFTIPSGFSGLREADHLDHVQVGWSGPSIEARYGFSVAQLDTSPRPLTGPSQIELAGGGSSGAPPLSNRASRTRQNLQGAYEPAAVGRHSIVVGGGWEVATIRNRFDGPSGGILVTANGAPEYSIALNTPVDSRESVRTGSVYVRDEIKMAAWMTIDAAAVADFARGSGAGQPVQIAWNSISPRAGLAVTPPMLRRLTVRGSYSRLYDPLAGRYLDFAANSLGGVEYAGGQIIGRFGGPYSRIDSDLKRPYADEFNLGAEARLPVRISAAIRLFRRDEKDRIAAMDIGVPASAYKPIEVLDPGPDSLPGTFDDQTLIVYAQDPATLGKDQYLLTNPAGLRMLNEGMTAEASGRWRFAQAHASFMAVKSYGATNPGDSVTENDPGVVGALWQDPNSSIHAAGRDYFDRAYVGKAQLTARLPKRFGGIEWANAAVYMDGLVFARMLLVTGLPQGPFLAATTVRGSPEGGNRAEYVLNWNLRLSRVFGLPRGSVRVALDVLNVTNENNRLQESDISGPLFNRRLPVAIEPSRFLRFNVQYRF